MNYDNMNFEARIYEKTIYGSGLKPIPYIQLQEKVWNSNLGDYEDGFVILKFMDLNSLKKFKNKNNIKIYKFEQIIQNFKEKLKKLVK